MKNAFLVLLPIFILQGADQSAPRPKILGIAHAAFYVSDLEKTRGFYRDFLGYAEPFALKNADQTGDRIAFIKINDYQYIELFNEKPRAVQQLNHISFYTEDAHKMRDYLASKGVKVPDKVGKGKTGNFNYNITDPDGNIVEMVEYQPDSWTGQRYGKLMPDTRISDHIAHVGVVIGPLAASMRFYHDLLGFNEFWRGGGSPSMVSWVNARVPDGRDYLEMMLYDTLPDPAKRGTKNHICLVVPDVEKAVAMLKSRPAYKTYGKDIAVKVGVNHKRQANLFDPDETRIELMEADTFDGKPVPPSTAPVALP